MRIVPIRSIKQGFTDVDFDALALHSNLIGFEMMRSTNNLASFKPFIADGLVKVEGD